MQQRLILEPDDFEINQYIIGHSEKGEMEIDLDNPMAFMMQQKTPFFFQDCVYMIKSINLPYIGLVNVHNGNHMIADTRKVSFMRANESLAEFVQMAHGEKQHEMREL